MNEQIEQARQYYRQRDYPQTIAHCNAILAQEPKQAEAYRYLAQSCLKTGQNEQANNHIEKAIALDPQNAVHYFVQGNIARAMEQEEQQVAAYEKAVALDPDFYEALCNLAVILKVSKRKRAQQYLEHAIEVKPEKALAYSNLGVAQIEVGEIDAGAQTLKQAVTKDNVQLETYEQYALALAWQGRFTAQKAVLEYAIKRSPDNQLLKASYARVILQLGYYKRGWRLYADRFLAKPDAPSYTPDPQNTPRLKQGMPIKGKKIWLRPEQGHGDCIQFLGYAKWLKSQGATVVVEAFEVLVSLFKAQDYIDECVQWPCKPQNVDYCMPMLDFGEYYQIDDNTKPVEPFIQVPKDEPAEIKKLIKSSKKPRIGFYWKGSSVHKHDKFRSTDLAQWQKLVKQKAFQWYSLQYQPTKQEQTQLKKWGVIDCSQPLTSFAAAASIMQHMDLVIGVDSSYIHLAAGMDKPTWNLLVNNPDWRWGTTGEGTHWYPQMCLFRQSEPKAWDPIFKQIEQRLKDYKKSPKTVIFHNTCSNAPSSLRKRGSKKQLKPRTLIIVPVWNRKEITELALKSLMKHKGPHADLWVYNDWSTDYNNKWLSKLCDKVIQLPPSDQTVIKNEKNTKGMGVAHLRWAQFRDFAEQHDYDYLYLTDSDVIHDPTFMTTLFELHEKYQIEISHDKPQMMLSEDLKIEDRAYIMKMIGLIGKIRVGHKVPLPICLFDDSLGEHKRNAVYSNEEMSLRLTAPGASQFYTKEMVQHIVNRLEKNLLDQKADQGYGWDCTVTKWLRLPWITPTVSYVEHFGAEGMHTEQDDWDRCCAVKLTEYLKDKRGDVLKYLQGQGKKPKM
jgi:tetratricopeptide (TPR) repeat protein